MTSEAIVGLVFGGVTAIALAIAGIWTLCVLVWRASGVLNDIQRTLAPLPKKVDDHEHRLTILETVQHGRVKPVEALEA